MHSVSESVPERSQGVSWRIALQGDTDAGTYRAVWVIRFAPDINTGGQKTLRVIPVDARANDGVNTLEPRPPSRSSSQSMPASGTDLVFSDSWYEDSSWQNAGTREFMASVELWVPAAKVASAAGVRKVSAHFMFTTFRSSLNYARH